ncbi:unnamed protein product [Leptidea sinapis]|uniref:Uncharacterized protein n=1 Tax=Leptidea sinapis TaxID=189913 RepID=A0A5E4PXE9_9NEOP|nr:unnamed protein product [Leptidea sinapis]
MFVRFLINSGLVQIPADTEWHLKICPIVDSVDYDCFTSLKTTTKTNANNFRIITDCMFKLKNRIWNCPEVSALFSYLNPIKFSQVMLNSRVQDISRRRLGTVDRNEMSVDFKSPASAF